MRTSAKMLCLTAVVLSLSSPALGQDIVTFGPPQAQASAARPDVYVVQNGDTLWDISTRFLGDAKYWPLLWSINEHITNPHWIYPGNRIVFVPGTDIEPPSLALDGGESGRDGYTPDLVNYEEDGMACGLDVRFENSYPSTRFKAPAYLEDSEKLPILGRIYKARTGQTFLGERDIVYLQLKDTRSMECGDVVTVYRKEEKKIRHPNTRRIKYGKFWRVLGDARVLHVKGNIAMAELRGSNFEAQRGDIVGPRMPVELELPVESSSGDMNAVVVARLNKREAMLDGTNAVLVLDRGKRDGVRIGNTFYLVEQLDEYADREGSWDDKLPPSVIGRVVVVRVDERSSTAVVVDATRHVEVGQRARMSME